MKDGNLPKPTSLPWARLCGPLILTFLFPLAAGAAPAWLVRNGKSAYSIVIAPDASPSERHGAAELQKFLKQISGARLPITSEPQPSMVLVGQSPALDKLNGGIPLADLGPEGFALKAKGKNLVIAGGRQRGTMYGVYEFLEKLGCRWFTADVSRIPKMRSIALPSLDEVQKPSFEAREPFFPEAADPDWAARNKVNGQSMRLDAARGGKLLAYPGGHSFEALVPPEKYFKEHPEYYSLVDGKRRIDEYRSQLCLTNPDVLRIATETVERWIAEHADATNLSVVQNDGEGWCECDNCRRVEAEEGGAHSGPVLRFVNALAEQIEKKHPDKLIDTFAYSYTLDPPLKVRPRKNVRIRVCPSDACFAHPFEKCEYDATVMRDLVAWSKITDQLYIWHYNINFLHYLLPFPDFDELAADIPMYQRHGVVGLFMEGSTDREGGAENAELRSYVMAKLMWNTKVDVNKVIDEFHEAYYGKAAKPMRAYFDMLQSRVRQAPDGPGYHLWIGDPPSSPYLGGDFLDKATELFHQAEAAENDTVSAHVRKSRLAIDYIRLSRTKKFIVQGDSYQPADLNGAKEMWNALVAACRKFGISHISENSTLTQEDRLFQDLVHPYRVTSLENERLIVHVVPELGGRVTHIIDKRTGRNLIQEPEPAGTRSKIYPNMGGLTVNVYTDYTAYKTYPFRKWELDPGATPTALALSATSDKLTIRRKLWLEGAFLRTETVVENRSGAPVEALLESRWEVDPSGLATAVAAYRKQAGGTAEQDLRISGRQTYTGPGLPDGEWRVINRSGGPLKVNRFSNAQVARCYLDWGQVNENYVGMAVVSPRRMLQPGEQLTLQSDYGVE